MAVDEDDNDDVADAADGALDGYRSQDPTPTAPPTSSLTLAPIPTDALKGKAPYSTTNLREKVFFRFGDIVDYDDALFFDIGMLRYAADCVAD